MSAILNSRRILILGSKDLDGDQSFGELLADILGRAGCETIYVDCRSFRKKSFFKLRRSIAKRLNRRQDFYYYTKPQHKAVREIFSSFKPDIVIRSGFFYSELDRELIVELKKKYSFKFVLFDIDSRFVIQEPKRFSAFLHYEFKLYDLVLSFSKVVARFYNRLGFGNVIFFPYGAARIPIIETKKITDLLFIGAPDLRRLFFLERLSAFNLKVYGKRWKTYNDMISPKLSSQIYFQNIWNDEKYQLMQQSKIVLNISFLLWSAMETGVNLRVFEALAARNFLLSDYNEELGELFEIGKDLETFKTGEELFDKARFYLANEAARERIAASGYQKILKYHTWDERADELLSLLSKL